MTGPSDQRNFSGKIIDEIDYGTIISVKIQNEQGVHDIIVDHRMYQHMIGERDTLVGLDVDVEYEDGIPVFFFKEVDVE